MSKVRRQNGFTLTELIIVMAIMATLLSIAAVSISNYQRRNAVKEAARAIDGDIMAIRTTARLRQTDDIVVDFATDYNYTACIDTNAAPGCQPSDFTIVSRSFGNNLARFQVFGLTTPNLLTFTRLGNIPEETDIVVRLEPEPDRLYRVKIFRSGLTRVEFTETGLPPWGRAW